MALVAMTNQPLLPVPNAPPTNPDNPAPARPDAAPEPHDPLPPSWLVTPALLAAYYRSNPSARSLAEVLADMYRVPHNVVVERLRKYKTYASGRRGPTGGDWRRRELVRRLHEAAKILDAQGFLLRAVPKPHPHHWTKFVCVPKPPPGGSE